MGDKTATLSDKYLIKQCYVVFIFTTSVYAYAYLCTVYATHHRNINSGWQCFKRSSWDLMIRLLFLSGQDIFILPKDNFLWPPNLNLQCLNYSYSYCFSMLLFSVPILGK